MIFGFFVTFAVMNLSQAFIEQLRGLLPAEWEALAQAITSTEPSVAVRVNEARGAAVPADACRVPWCGPGFYLQDRPTFTFDTDWHAGRYYVQDASSMFIAHVIRSLVHEPVRYLDLCAAPGGKTTAALQALPPYSMVVANEIVPPRARVLTDNVIRWGTPRCVVTSNAPAHFGKMTHFFDVIAADVPCSGEGMMRKDDEAVAQWSPALVEQCAQRQREILTDVWQALRPGGLLIYSTCTYNRQENEQMADFIVSELGATASCPIVWTVKACSWQPSASRAMPPARTSESRKNQQKKPMKPAVTGSPAPVTTPSVSRATC